MDHLCYLCLASVFHAFASVYCCLVVTYWERDDLLALVCGVKLRFCHFPMWYPGSGVVLDLCPLSYFEGLNFYIIFYRKVNIH